MPAPIWYVVEFRPYQLLYDPSKAKKKNLRGLTKGDVFNDHGFAHIVTTSDGTCSYP